MKKMPKWILPLALASAMFFVVGGLVLHTWVIVALVVGAYFTTEGIQGRLRAVARRSR